MRPWVSGRCNAFSKKKNGEPSWGLRWGFFENENPRNECVLSENENDHPAPPPLCTATAFGEKKKKNKKRPSHTLMALLTRVSGAYGTETRPPIWSGCLSKRKSFTVMGPPQRASSLAVSNECQTRTRFT